MSHAINDHVVTAIQDASDKASGLAEQANRNAQALTIQATQIRSLLLDLRFLTIVLTVEGVLFLFLRAFGR